MHSSLSHFSAGWLASGAFKAQNMSLNSYVTLDGGEIGQAQAIQALAAGIVPTVEMSPVLLKPRADMHSQVVLLGKTLANMSARDYRANFCFQPSTWCSSVWTVCASRIK